MAYDSSPGFFPIPHFFTTIFFIEIHRHFSVDIIISASNFIEIVAPPSLEDSFLSQISRMESV